MLLDGLPRPYLRLPSSIYLQTTCPVAISLPAFIVFNMLLEAIEEETPYRLFSTDKRTNIYDTGDGPVDGDNASFSTRYSYSTNDTMSNNVGAGRVLGNFYGKAGKRLERVLGGIAHRAGFGPDAIYQKVQTLYLEDWKTDSRKGEI